MEMVKEKIAGGLKEVIRWVRGDRKKLDILRAVEICRGEGYPLAFQLGLKKVMGRDISIDGLRVALNQFEEDGYIVSRRGRGVGRQANREVFYYSITVKGQLEISRLERELRPY